MNAVRVCLASIAAAIGLLGVACSEPVYAEKKEAPKRAVFAVHCYDVGKAALVRLDGVRAVKNGWRGRLEVNVVRYDASRVSVDKMVKALEDAGTFIRVVER
jgi:copper chaperone CopZ